MKTLGKITRNTHSEPTGLLCKSFDSHSITLVVRGTKIIHNGDYQQTVREGELVYAPAGRHFAEFVPDKNSQFEEISVHIGQGELSRYIKMLCADLGLQVEAHHKCDGCDGSKYIVHKAWREVRVFFNSLSPMFHAQEVNPTIESLKIMELLALLILNADCCIQNRLLSDGDPGTESFETVVRGNVFNNLTINELASMTNRSVTSFKNEFMRLFREPPHQWILRQRLAYARTLIITTDRQVNDIAMECAMCNASHFVRVFREAFELPPAEYRKRHGKNAKLVRSQEWGDDVAVK